jgi:hypothetical protein
LQSFAPQPGLSSTAALDDDARAALEKVAARITSDVLPLLERLGID